MKKFKKFFSRFTRLALLFRCFVRVVFHGAATKVPSKISRIIVVPTGKLGDVVCNTPVLRALRTNMPQAHIIVAGNSKLHQALFADSGLVDEYLDLEAPGAIERVQKVHAEVALVTGPSYTFVATLCAAGVPLVIAPMVVGGFSPAETRLYKILKTCIKTFPYSMTGHAPWERLRVLEPVGISTDDTKKHLGFSATSKEKILELFRKNGFDQNQDFIVGMSPSSGNKIKEWPEERFAEVADHLSKNHSAKIIFVGSKNDEEKIDKTIGYMKSGAPVLRVTDLNIDELKALVSCLTLFVAVDTGPIYIAEAFGIPTVDIVGPVDENAQPPIGFIHRNVVPPNRTHAAITILNARSYDAEEATRQTLSITASAVIETIDKLVKDLRK